MVVRIARILSASLVLVLWANVRPATCEGWSLPNPFSSETKTKAKQKPVVRAVKKEPSVLEKLGTGTRSFFSRAGETLGLKKPEPKKYSYASAVPPKTQSVNRAETKSWLPSMFQPEEPKKPKTVSEWMDNKRLDP
jgi:hypothetical protein